MHNNKDIRKNLEIFKKKLSETNTNFDIEDFNKKDILNRELISKKEKLEQEKKIYLSQKINQILKNRKKFLKKLKF